jgi:hypothetical protein
MSTSNTLIELSCWLGNTAYMSFFHVLDRSASMSLSHVRQRKDSSPIIWLTWTERANLTVCLNESPRTKPIAVARFLGISLLSSRTAQLFRVVGGILVLLWATCTPNAFRRFGWGSQCEVYAVS